MKGQKVDLTTFGGRLCYAMQLREFSAHKMSQELCRNGFSCTRKNIEQWWRINDDTWRGCSARNNHGNWSVIEKGPALSNSRHPYPAEIQLIVLTLKINGMWLFVGGSLDMERGGNLPETRDDLTQLWESDTDTRTLMDYVMGLSKDARAHMVKYLIATGQIPKE